MSSLLQPSPEKPSDGKYFTEVQKKSSLLCCSTVMFSTTCHGARDFLFKSFHKIYILDIILSTINNALDKCVKFDRIAISRKR